MAAEQKDDGRVPVIIPSESSTFQHGLPEKLFDLQSTAVGWGDVAALLPWQMYLRAGDAAVLEEAYPAARRWVDGMAQRAATKRGLARRLSRGIGAQERFILDTGFHYGEWLRPGAHLGKELGKNLIKPPAAVATAYLAHSAATLARTARVLGKRDDAVTYTSLAAEVRTAWNLAFVRDGGSRIGDDKQDDYVRALAFELLPDAHRGAALDRLVQLVIEAGGHIGTGFLSTALLLPTLSRNGRADIAFQLLLQTTAPSWLAQIDEGASTIWETWEGYEADGKAVRSHNHYALGSVVTWLHEDLAGLRVTEPGYQRMTIDPAIGGGVTSASSRVQTPYGPAESSWLLEDGHVTLSFVVPLGCTADVRTADGLAHFAAGTHKVSYPLPTPRRDATGRPNLPGQTVALTE